jgi:hypothetical protein
MTTALYVRVIFLLKSVLGAHFVNVRLWAGKMNTLVGIVGLQYLPDSIARLYTVMQMMTL